MSFWQKYRALILVIIAVLALLAVTPLIQQYVSAPTTQPITELYMLGSNHNATYPYNITSGESYLLYLTVNNHLGSSGNYMLQMKFRNQTMSGPDSFNHIESNLTALAKYTFTLDNDKSFELPVNVTFNYQLDQILPQMNLNNITVNDQTFQMDNLAVPWDSSKNAYLGNLFFELYLYNSTTNDFQYNQRYLSLWVNLS